MTKLQKIFLIFILFFISSSVNAEQWVNTNNKTTPVVFIDMDNIHKYSNSIVLYPIRYFNSKNGDTVTIILADLQNNKAGVMSVMPYEKNKQYDWTIPADINMKSINESSPIYASYQIVKKFYITTNNTNNEKIDNNPEYFKPYMIELQRRIKSNWDPPKGYESKKVVVVFSINRDGKLLNVEVLKSSGVPAVDKAAITAVELSAPFRQLPSKFKGNKTDIQFTFDYNVYR